MTDLPTNLLANPRDVNLWLAHAEWLTEEPAGRATWERTENADVCECGHARHYHELAGGMVDFCLHTGSNCECPHFRPRVIDRTSWPYHLTPPHEARLTALMLKWEYECYHGTERFAPHNPMNDAVVPTFSLLLDHPGTEACEECHGIESVVHKDGSEEFVNCQACSCSGKVTIDGHLTLLVRDLATAGDPRAGELAAREVHSDSPTSWWIDFDQAGILRDYPSRLDALRALHARIWATMTEECPSCDDGRVPKSTAPGRFGGPCPKCCGLGWRVKLPT